MLTRRGLISGLLATPAIIAVDRLMPVRALNYRGGWVTMFDDHATRRLYGLAGHEVRSIMLDHYVQSESGLWLSTSKRFLSFNEVEPAMLVPDYFKGRIGAANGDGQIVVEAAPHTS